MTKKNSLKKALITSALSMVLCSSMLVGTTYAWFTDSVSSNNNIIQTGNLDIGMYWAEGNKAAPTNDDGWTDASKGAIFNNTKWEPGHLEAKYIKIENDGTLALKYKLVIVPNGAVDKLADVIDVYYIDGAKQVTRTDLAKLTPVGTLRDMIEDPNGAAYGYLLAEDESTEVIESVKALTLVLKMREEAGNEYKNMSIGTNFSVQLLATQYTYEEDSIDENYDADAPYPEVIVVADEAYYSDYTATEDYTVDGGDATIVGVATSADVFTWNDNIPEMSTIFSSENGSKVTVNDLTFTGTMSAIMLGHYQNATYNNYDTEFNNVNVLDAEVVSFSSGISPAVCVYGTAVLNNCTITGTTLSELDTDPMWPVYDMAVVNYSTTTLNNTKVGSIYVWNQANLIVAEGSEVDTIVLRGDANMRNDTQVVTVKAGATVDAIDLSAITDTSKVKITIEEGATVGKFVDGNNEYETIAKWQEANKGVTRVSTATALKTALAAGGNVVLTTDVALTEGVTVPAGAKVELDLNGKNITMESETAVSMITNNGSLTINGTGKIAYTFNGTPNTDKAANTIENGGVLVVNGGEISNTGNGNQIGYGIDNRNGSTLTVNGGKITATGSSYYDGIRLMCGSNDTTVTVNGGEISSIWAQNPSANKENEVKGTVIINGGTVNTTYYENYTTVKVAEGVTATVTPYGAGSDNTTSAVVDGYTVYSFVH